MVYKGVDAGNGTTTYHLNVLEDNGFIKSTKKGLHKFYFRTGVKFPYVLQSKLSYVELEILKVLQTHGRISVSQIAAVIKKSAQTASYNIKQLERMRFVGSYKEDQKKVCDVTERGKEYLAKHTLKEL